MKKKNYIQINDLAGFFAIIIIIASLFFIGAKYNGFAVGSDEATINLTIDDLVRINFTIDSINFGSGFIEDGKSYAILDSTGNVINGNWTPVYEGFRIENTGNRNVSLYLKSNKNKNEFIGGQNSSYQYNVTNYEINSCTQAQINFSGWYDFNTTGDGTKICTNFNSNDNRDSIRVDIRIQISSDADPGVKSDVITATGIAI